MKEIKLSRMELKNFKGIKYFLFEPKGDNVRVYGDNATGKTTLFDAFIWLLFDKDSSNKKDFSIKTLEENGETVHDLEHGVEITFLINGEEVMLKKVYSEKWTKKRGSINKSLTGHKTLYFVDGIPTKKKDFDDYISSIVKEDIFKLLTSPSYFNESLHWKERRNILLELCGDITKEEVIKENKHLEKLFTVLDTRTPEDHKKMITERRKEISKELDAIPLRMDEVKRSIPDVVPLEENIKRDIEDLEKKLKERKEELAVYENGGTSVEKRIQLGELKGQLQEMKHKLQEESFQKVNEANEKVTEIKMERENSSYLAKDKKRTLSTNNKIMNNLYITTKELREKWHEVNEKEMDISEYPACTCPACGQDLPEEKVEEAKEKAEKEFNLKKAQELEEIQEEGKKTKKDMDDLENLNKLLEKEIKEIEGDLTKKEEELTAALEKLEEAKRETEKVEENNEYQKKLKEMADLEKEIEEGNGVGSQEVNKIKEAIDALQKEKRESEGLLYQAEQTKQLEARLEELEREQRELSKELEEIEEVLYLIEEFVKTKVTMLEERINSKFEHARFKMFEDQLNDGIKETCETMYKGVPYGSGLNNAARINVGLDIIATLQEHYGLFAPIFVDNAEAVTKLINTEAQTISLVVSEKDQELRVEY